MKNHSDNQRQEDKDQLKSSHHACEETTDLTDVNKQAVMIRLILSGLGLIISGFCYFVFGWRLPAGILLLIIIFINYLEAKKEYKAELDKIDKIDEN